MIDKSKITSEEFDIHVGLSYAGSEEQYLKFLRRYFSMVEEKAARIKRCCDSEDTEEYTIEVHALKSNSRLIGATALSELAEYLEQCGKAGDISEIKSKTPDLLKALNKVQDLFSFVTIDESSEVGELELSTEDQIVKYKRIINALDDFDIDKAGNDLDELLNYNISGRQAEYIFRAKKKVVDFAYDKAMEIMNDALSSLQDERLEDASKFELSILIVDDNDMNRSLAAEMLEEIGADTVAASSGKEAIETLKNHHFDLILLDQMMPEMDGVETLKEIKAKKLAKDTPIVVLTADSVAGSREKYIALGFDDYLPKPMYIDSVLALLEKFNKK